MTDETKPSSEWDLKTVVERLNAKITSGQPVSAQVFLTDGVPAEELSDKAQQIIQEACTRLKLDPGAVKLGKVHRLARSFSVSADVPHVFDEIAQRDDVKAILDSEQADIMPKPVSRKDVP